MNIELTRQIKATMHNELRQDLVSGDWVIFSPGREKRPHDLIRQKSKRKIVSQTNCPFEDLEKSGNWPPLVIFSEAKDWKVVVIPNKYPVLRSEGMPVDASAEGPYARKNPVGFHELIVVRDHKKNFAHLEPALAEKVFQLIADRYRFFEKDKRIAYASSFFNWGPTAGASLYHPHYQVMGLPVIPPPVAYSLNGSERYFKLNKRCVHCDILAFERKTKTRVLFEDAHTIALAPFASQTPYEVRVYPKQHNSSFEYESPEVLASAAHTLQHVLLRMETSLNDPDLNFFLHTTPLRHRYKHYHWHIEVMPRISTLGGLEYGTGININTVLPEETARLLR